MYSQIYSGLNLIFAILRNFRVAGAYRLLCVRLMRPPGKYSILLSNRSKKVTLGPLFRSKNDENRACVTKRKFNHIVVIEHDNSKLVMIPA